MVRSIDLGNSGSSLRILHSYARLEAYRPQTQECLDFFGFEHHAK